jgi:hypothetical protein
LSELLDGFFFIILVFVYDFLTSHLSGRGTHRRFFPSTPAAPLNSALGVEILRKYMSIFSLSQTSADSVFGYSNVALIVGAALVFLGTIGVIWSSGIRERYANERISKNEAETAIAKANAAKAEENAAAANERTEVLREENLATQRELERERLERVRLEAKIAPRRLSQEQRSTLVNELKSGPQPITIEFTRLGDLEASMYADAILTALGSAGVKGVVNNVGVQAPPRYGVHILVNSKSPKAMTIKDAFEKARIPAEISFADTGTFDAKILVGLRPLGANQ